jgi:hypothetical protein
LNLARKFLIAIGPLLRDGHFEEAQSLAGDLAREGLA